MTSASIVTYHTDVMELKTCLRALAGDKVKRIYIIDNGCDDKIRDLASGYHNVIYIPSANRGYGAGHNIALRKELGCNDCAYHLVLNSDTDFSPKIIADIETYMDSHPDVGCLQPHLYSVDGTRQFSCRRLPSPFDVFIRRFVPKRFFRSSREKYLLSGLDPALAWDIPYHQGSFLFLRKEALVKTGIFDERFFMYPEDIDLTRRIHREYRTICWPGASVIHRHNAASYKSIRMLWIHVINMIRYFNKWGWFYDEERKRFNNSIRSYR